MFELVVTLCLLSAPSDCRQVLLPGYEAGSAAACIDALAARPVDLSDLTADTTLAQPPQCHPSGPAAEMTAIAPGVFAHRGQISDAAADNYGDVSNFGFVIGERSVAVIDSGGSRRVGEELYRAVRAQTGLPISHVILTHMHPDHVMGASVFAGIGARVVGHDKLSAALADRAATYLANFGGLIGADQFIGTRIISPDLIVSGEMSIDLGNRVLLLRRWPISHTSTDLTVLDTNSGILFTGDLVFHEHTPALDGSVLGWVAVLDQMADLPVQRVVPGHGGPVLDWPAGLADLDRYLAVLISDTRAAIQRGDALSIAADTIARSEAPNWQLFELFNARNATVAYTELEWE